MDIVAALLETIGKFFIRPVGAPAAFVVPDESVTQVRVSGLISLISKVVTGIVFVATVPATGFEEIDPTEILATANAVGVEIIEKPNTATKLAVASDVFFLNISSFTVKGTNQTFGYEVAKIMGAN
jgi:hypothetical protein